MERHKVNATIVGGYGGMGQIFAKLFKEEGFDVTISGPTEEKGEKASVELGVEYVKDNVDAVADADVVVVTVPIKRTLDVIREVAPHLKPDSLLMDLTSVKKMPCDAMLEHAKKNVEVLGAHPMFGPRAAGVEGQVVILTPVRSKRWVGFVEDLLRRHRVKVFNSTPEEHDRIMAVVQGLTHLSYIAFGKTLQEMNFDIKKSRNFSSPIYELMLDMAGRIIGQDPRLYAEIQMTNPYTKEVHRVFIKTLADLSSIIEENDEEKFVEMMVDAARHFDDVDRAMGRSDKAIESLVLELEKLKESIGKELCLQHIYSGMKHLGVVRNVTADSVVLEDNGRMSTLKLSNIRVLGDKERIEFKTQKYGTTLRDFSAVIDSGADEFFIASLLGSFSDAIVSVNIKDVYSGPKIGDNRKSVCFSVELINVNTKEIESLVREFLSKIGGKLR